MERKLLSLPSFFVLLLIAGIAFLAAPVEDVQAAAPDPPTFRYGAEGTATTPTKLETGGSTAVVTIRFDQAVAVTPASPTDAQKEAGFGPEDLKVVITDTSPAATSASRQLLTADITVAAVAAAASPPPAANQYFKVTVDVPANGKGTITVSVLGTDADGSFNNIANPAEGYDTNADTAATAVEYDTYDGTAPEVEIETDATSIGLARFLVTFTFTDNAGFDDDGPVLAETSIMVTGGGVKELGRRTGDGSADDPYMVSAYVQADANVDEVIIGVVKDAVMDASGNGNAAIAHERTDDTPTAGPAGALTVPVDTAKPVVDIALVTTPTAPSATTRLESIAVTFNIKEGTGEDAEATLSSALSETPADKVIAKDEVTVVGGTISDVTVVTGTFLAVFTATVRPDETAKNVTIAVEANALKDAAGNGNEKAETMPISTGYTAPRPAGPTESPIIGGPLEGKKGFTFTLPVITPSDTDEGSRFVVIAKSDSAINGISGTSYPVVNIGDEWQDLRDFLAYDGGTIDLIGPTGTTAKDLVISEVMWGSDNGLDDPTMSQWIELYNTKTTRGTANGIINTGEMKWTLEFHPGATSDAAVSDRFSNRQLGQNRWNIPDTSGGAYGQSGRTKTSASNPGTLRELVSMRRKIDYAKVQKNDHKAAGSAEDANNRTEQLKGVPDGALSGSWTASTSRKNMSGTRKGTPGAQHVTVVSTTGISKSVVFNEIANRSNKKFDWIELYNPGSSEVKINNWVLSKVTGVDKDDKLFKFESDENIVVPAKGFLLVVNEDPSETALAAGKNVDNPDSNANGLPTEIYIASGLDIPKEKYLLILRTEEKLKSHEKIVDIAGHLGDLSLVHTGSDTELWPLKAWKKIKTDDLGENNDKTWVRDKGKDLYHGDAWKSDGGYTGLGIDRNPDSDEGPTSGTPGFDNGAVKDKVKDLTETNPVVISEIMFGTGNGRDPQWIELYNPSKTQAVKLHNWRLEVQNTTVDRTETLNVEYDYTLILPDKRIQPNQTLLIVSASAREATRDRFPSDRIINIWSTRTLRETVEMSSARDAILSSVAFYIKLSDHEKQVVDEVGNIMRARDAHDWDLPGGNLEDGGRASMLRREGSFGDGTEADAWISAAAVDPGQKVGINELYYGNEDDVGTPGYRAGGPLPVQLSSFYSKRNAAGAVVITWSTESELDNAGFNILRSQSRTGEFVRINAQLIPGAGTTGEKSAYTWTDTSAKPNVLYFYQIEDVSLAGDHRTLRTTRLRGYIGAAGKATTTWGDLKSRE